jgi:glyoxylase-like metal-dependent hydrolase (beta-lactamase superfamily II)
MRSTGYPQYKPFVLVALLSVVPAVSSMAQGVRSPSPLDAVARAMGGRNRILAVQTLVMLGQGQNFNLGQNAAPDDSLPVYEVSEFRRLIDFSARRWRQEQVRTPRFVTGNAAPQRQITAGDGQLGFDILPDGSSRVATGRLVTDPEKELIHHPIGFLQAAFMRGSGVTDAGRQDGLRHVTLNFRGSKFGMSIDPRTSLPVRIQQTVYHPMLGDVLLETEFQDWQVADGLKLPARVIQKLDNRWTTSDIRLGSVQVNAQTGDLAALATLRSTPPAPQPVTIEVTETAPGVWFLAGQSHHSVVIEMLDHLLLVEAPLSDARTLAVIERARSLRPGKPLRAVINTHHHFDHAGGIRAAISEGLTVITHEGNKAFFESLARRRHAIVEDALAKRPQPARIETVSNKRVITDGTRTVEIHHIQGSQHAKTLLMVYLPNERQLIEADVYTPPATPVSTPATPPAAPFAANLLENINRLGLAVDTILPIHGRVVPMSELRTAAQPRVPGS